MPPKYPAMSPIDTPSTEAIAVVVHGTRRGQMAAFVVDKPEFEILLDGVPQAAEQGEHGLTPMERDAYALEAGQMVDALVQVLQKE